MEDRTIELFGNLAGKRKWKGAVLGPDGVIYGVPAGHGQVLQIDTATRKVTTIPGAYPNEHLWPGWKWSGGILHPATGTIFCIPTNAHSVLAIGPIGEISEEHYDVIRDRAWADTMGSVESFRGPTDTRAWADTRSWDLPLLLSRQTQSSMDGSEKSMSQRGFGMSPWQTSSTMLSTVSGDTAGLLAASLVKPRNQQQDRQPVRQMSQSVSLPRLPGSTQDPWALPRTNNISRGGGPTRSASAAALPNMPSTGSNSSYKTSPHRTR